MAETTKKKVTKIEPKQTTTKRRTTKKDKDAKDLKTLQDLVDLAAKTADNADNKQMVQFMCQFIYNHIVKAEFIGNDVVVFTDDGKVFIISAMVPKSDEVKEVKSEEEVK